MQQINQSKQTSSWQDIQDAYSDERWKIQAEEDLKNFTTVFILGKTRVGKSTLFHLIKGDKLLKKEKYDVYQIESLVGHKGRSHTKFFNVFKDEKEKIFIIDTPGLDDTQNGVQEIVSQLKFLTTLNKCKDPLFLFVVKFEETDNTNLQKTLRWIQELFNQECYTIRGKIRLVLTLCEYDDASEFQIEIKDCFETIQQDNGDETEQYLQYFLENLNDIFSFKKNAKEQEQNELRNKIIQFIKNQRNCEVSKLGQEENAGSQYQMIISDKGQKDMKKMIQQLRQFYEENLKIQYKNVIGALKSIEDQNTLFSICKKFINIYDKRLTIQRINKTIKKQIKVMDEFQLNQQCQNYILNQYDWLFTTEWFQIFLEFIIKQDENIQVDQSDQYILGLYQQLNASAKVLEQIYSDQTEAQNQILKVILSITKQLRSEIEQPWEKFVLFFGNRYSGKSTIANSIYNFQKIQDSSLKIFETNNNPIFAEKEVIDICQNPFKIILESEFIALKRYEKDILIEFKQFQQDLIPFTEYLLKLAVDEQKPFVMFLILDENQNNDFGVFNSLRLFLQRNDINSRWNLTIIENKKQQNNDLNIIKQIYPFIPKEYFISNLQLKTEKIEEYVFVENFNIQQQSFIINQFQSSNLKFCDIFLNKLHLCFIQIQKRVWESNFDLLKRQDLSRRVEIFLNINELNPQLESFQEKVNQICRSFSIEKQNFGNNQYKNLQNFHALLIQKADLLNMINSTFSEINTIYEQLNNLQIIVFQYLNYEFLQKIETTSQLIQILPILLDENQNEIIQILEIMKTISQYQLILNNKQCPSKKQIKKASASNDCLSLINQVKQQVKQKLKVILCLIVNLKESQGPSFRFKKYFYLKRIFFSAFKQIPNIYQLRENLEKIKQMYHQIKLKKPIIIK